MLAIAATLATKDCVVVGDSLALGIGTAINAHVQGTSCRISARRGAPASGIRRTTGPVSADVAIVSAGANDAASTTLRSDLQAIRRGIRARKVIWMIPTDPRAAAAVRQACRIWGDVGVDLSRHPTRDGVHPKDYWAVARHAFRIAECE
jgi:hypothetical protein